MSLVAIIALCFYQRLLGHLLDMKLKKDVGTDKYERL